MADEVERVQGQFVGERGQVRHEPLSAVVVRPVAGAVAALVGEDHSPVGGEVGGSGVPFVGVGDDAVQENDRGCVGWAALADVRGGARRS